MMTLFIMLVVVSILGALIGAKKPWLGGIAGLVMAPFLSIFNLSLDVVALTICAVALFLMSVAYGFLSFMIISGLKGGGHNTGQTYMSGFGAHHPGGIILSDAELQVLRDKKIRYVEHLSY